MAVTVKRIPPRAHALILAALVHVGMAATVAAERPIDPALAMWPGI